MTSEVTDWSYAHERTFCTGVVHRSRCTTMNTIQSINLIAINPAVRSGRPFILGTTITVADIAIARIYHPRTPDEIAEDYDLTLPQVYAALAYYYQYKSDMDAQIRQQIRRAEELKEKRVGNERSLLSR